MSGDRESNIVSLAERRRAKKKEVHQASKSSDVRLLDLEILITKLSDRVEDLDRDNREKTSQILRLLENLRKIREREKGY